MLRDREHDPESNVNAASIVAESTTRRTLPARRHNGLSWAICCFLVLLVAVIYGQVASFSFVGDGDSEFLYENPQVVAGITPSGVWWAMTSGPYGEWCPLSTLSEMLVCQFFGLSPAAHHLTNVLLHAASAVLLYLVLQRMTGDVWPSAWVAAVFAIHPLHVESVAWVSERRDVLSGLFFMLTLGAYALYAERPSLKRWLAVAGLFALGLAAKPMLVTVPCVLLLLDYWPLRRFQSTSVRRLILEKLPLLALALGACCIVLVTHLSSQPSNHMQRWSLATRMANASVSYVDYVSQSFWPVNMAIFYPHPGDTLPTVRVVGSLVVLTAITATAIFFWRRAPYLLVGWLWFLGTLVPVIGLVQVGSHARGDRYMYLSQIGLSIAVAWCVQDACRYALPRPWAAVAAMDDGGRRISDRARPDRGRVAPDFLLAQRRNTF